MGDLIKNMGDIDWAKLLPLLIPLALIEIGLMVWAVIDIAQRRHVTGGNKVVWILVVVIINFMGPLAYFIFGRRDEPAEDDAVRD
ncbi:MAG: PLDc N-terminal domain-containing protein [Dehalococcoidia bacterium]|nr:PLDc N-terminal domain-containing protein [Dehalococcoidia bacterium]